MGRRHGPDRGRPALRAPGAAGDPAPGTDAPAVKGIAMPEVRIRPAVKVSAPRPAPSAASADPSMIEIEDLTLHYGTKPALKGISMSIPKNKVTAFIGPSGCGKTTLLRCLNRMNDLIDGVRIEGRIRIGGRDIHDGSLDVIDLRKRVGMVFQKSNPFPKSIYDNVAYGPRILGAGSRSEIETQVESSLRSAALWDEVRDRLYESALRLSGGQQQRL